MKNLDAMYAKVARQAWQAMNDAADDFNRINVSEESSMEAPYLYVFADGSWTIDYPDYIQTTNGCISAVMVYHCNGPAELADDIEAEEDWDVIELELAD